MVPAGIVAIVVSELPAAERYTTLKPPMSAEDEPELTSSTNSFVAAPVTPVENSLILSPTVPPPPPPPPPPGTHVNTACAEESYESATVPDPPPAWQAMPLSPSSDVTPAP